MAKDPAFLFYSQDFYMGVADLSFEDRGKYISLLCLLHQKGRLNEETIRLCVGSISDNLKLKFGIDETGLWYNKRLEYETEKRNNFTESRRNNGKKGGRPENIKPLGKPKNNHMVSHMGNENENEIINNNSSSTYSEKFKKVWEQWKQYRKEQHQTEYKGLQSEDLALMNLNELSFNHEETAIKIIKHTMSNTWKNFIVPTSIKKSISSQVQFDPIKR